MMASVPRPLARAGVVLLAATVGLAATAAAQTSRPRTASLARVLASVADDHRTGQPVYLVANTRFPEQVVGVFGNIDAAMGMVRDSGAGFAAFGPYVTQRDESPWEIVSVTVVRRRGAAMDTVALTVAESDALFLTKAAAQRFLVPYYAMIYGQPFADEVWAAIELLGPLGGGGGTGHCTSRACEVADPVFRVLPPFVASRRAPPR